MPAKAYPFITGLGYRCTDRCHNSGAISDFVRAWREGSNGGTRWAQYCCRGCGKTWTQSVTVEVYEQLTGGRD